MPAVREIPTECLSKIISILFLDIETAFFELFVLVLDAEVSHICESIAWNDTALFAIRAIGIDLDDNLGYFATIRLDLSADVRLIEDLIFSDFTANRISLSNDRDDLLKLDIDLTELLQALLIVQLVTHLLLKLFFSATTLVFKSTFLLTHLAVELFSLLFKLLKSLLTVSTGRHKLKLLLLKLFALSLLLFLKLAFGFFNFFSLFFLLFANLLLHLL